MKLDELMSGHWLSLNTIETITNIINKSYEITQSLVFIANHTSVNTLLITIKQTSMSQSINQIVFILHVGWSKDTCSTFLSDNCRKGNHFTLAVYSMDTRRLIYGDTLGWPIPEEFVCTINNIATLFNEPAPHITICHTHEFDSNTCNLSCSKFYPVQTCNDVCGVAVIVMCSLATYSRKNFINLAVGCENNGRLCHIKFISEWSGFLRYIICQWIVRDSIDITEIYNYESKSICKIYDTNGLNIEETQTVYGRSLGGRRLSLIETILPGRECICFRCNVVSNSDDKTDYKYFLHVSSKEKSNA